MNDMTIKKLSDAEVVSLLTQLSNEVVDSIEVDIAPELDALRRVHPQLGALVSEHLESEVTLDDASSAASAREILTVLAQHPDLGPLIESRAATFSDDRMAVGTAALGIGVAVAIVFAAIRRFRFERKTSESTPGGERKESVTVIDFAGQSPDASFIKAATQAVADTVKRARSRA